jgi:BMFP domain-containing protein YqiC
MQTDNRVLDGMARFFTNAAGAAQAFRAEMETMVRARVERLIADLDFVPREEFDAIKAMASKARTENDRLAARVTQLEARLGIASPQAVRTQRTSHRAKPLAKRRRRKL